MHLLAFGVFRPSEVFLCLVLLTYEIGDSNDIEQLITGNYGIKKPRQAREVVIHSRIASMTGRVLV